MDKKQQAVIYARFSPRRNAAECESCETQIEYCRKHCEAKNWNVVSVERDDGISGARSDNRPGLQKAIFLAMKNKAVMVVYSLSRLARNTRETIEISDRLQKFSAHLASVREPIDTTSAIGFAFFQIMAVLAELERKQIAERTSDAMIRHQSTGRRMCGRKRLPYGWQLDKTDDRRMVHNEYEQKVLARAIQLKSDGVSLRGICKVLTLEGYRARAVDDIQPDGTARRVPGKFRHNIFRNLK